MPDDVEALAADILGETDRPPTGTGRAASAPPAAEDALPLAETVEVSVFPESGGDRDAVPEAILQGAGRLAKPVGATRTERAILLPDRAAARGPDARGQAHAEPAHTPESKARLPEGPSSSEIPSTHQSELGVADQRRLDVDAKQELIAKLLHDTGCEGLLVLHPANFRWLTSGATPAGLFGRDETPALFFNPHQRWLVASATDSPRLFAEELDGLGFQLKEWHWTVSREQFLADMAYGRNLASDQPFRNCKPAGAFFAHTRRRLTAYETERLAELGEVVAHAVEATARHFDWGDPEEEIAGHLAHRLLRHGAEPVALQISGDGRGRAFRRRGFQSDPVQRVCILQSTARKFGLHATVSRTVYRSPPDEYRTSRVRNRVAPPGDSPRGVKGG